MSLSLLTHEDQIYLLGFYLRTNIIDIGEEMSKEKPDYPTLFKLIMDELHTEYGIIDSKVTDEILEMWEVEQQ